MTTTSERVKTEIARLLTDLVGREAELLMPQLTAPPSPELGDFAFPCFPLAQVMRKSPPQIADDIAGILRHKLEERPSPYIAEVRNAGAYVNFFVRTEGVAREVLKEIERSRDRYGRVRRERGERRVTGEKTVMVEYGQPNTHKEFHVGHLRNVLVGAVISNLLEAAGSRVIRASYIGDVGAHVAKTLWGMLRFHKGEKPPAAHRTEYLGKIYTEAAQALEKHPEWEAEVREVDRRLAFGDKELVKLWKTTRAWSLAEFRRIFRDLGARFDITYYESEMEKPGQRVVDELIHRGIAQIKESAPVVDLTRDGLDELVVRRKDGTALYSTKDLALAYRKFKDYRLDESIYVVDVRQSFYFKQLLRTLQLAGFAQPMRHLAHEFVTLPEGAMSSRRGNIVTYEEFRDEVVRRAREETRKRHPQRGRKGEEKGKKRGRKGGWSAKKTEKTARAVAFAAIRYEMLRNDLDRPIVFDIARALAFEGATGPYLQYTVARVTGILRKGGKEEEKGRKVGRKEEEAPPLGTRGGGEGLWASPEEKRLVLDLARYLEVVAEAARVYRPSLITQYLFDLAKAFADFYEKHPVIRVDPPLRTARLRLVRAVGQVMENGLAILDIPVVREM